MNHFFMFRWATRLGLVFTLVVMVFIYIQFAGVRLTEKQAGLVCANIVYTNVSEDFKIVTVYYKKFFTLTESRVELKIVYSNERKVTVDCIFKRNYRNNIIFLKNALIIDPKGELLFFNNINIRYDSDVR